MSHKASKEIAASELLLQAKKLHLNQSILLSWRGRNLSSYHLGEVLELCDSHGIDALASQLQGLVASNSEKGVAVLSEHPEVPVTWVPVGNQADVALYGLGRIGRILLRLASDQGTQPIFNIKAIVVRPGNVEQRLSLTKRDSVHGRFFAESSIEEVDGQKYLNLGTLRCAIIEQSDPESVDYEAVGLSNVLVIDNSGVFKNKEALSRHLKSKGATRVLLTAPADGAPNLVVGLNDQDHFASTRESGKPSVILSAASCTTNAVSPILDLLDRGWGLEHCHFETIHSYTNGQMLVDTKHKSAGRSRAAAENIVISTTGAAKAVSKILPQLAGKVTGNAVRIPSANVSLVIVSAYLKTDIDLQSFEAKLAEYEQAKPWLLGIEKDPVAASTDYRSDARAVIVDEDATIIEGRKIIVYGWYDNEWGYSAQVIRLASAALMSGQFSGAA